MQAAPAAPAPPVQQQQWVQCTNCQKWRVVSPTVYQATVAQGSEDAPWYCDMNFDRCAVAVVLGRMFESLP